MIHIADGAAQERAKYAEIWGLDEYRAGHSPGLMNVDRFMSVMAPEPGSTVIDLGAGACVAGLELRRRGLDVWWLDITNAAVPDDVPRNRFIEAPLWSRWDQSRPLLKWDYGYCCDVMEHIPPEYTMLCASRVIEACRESWFHIALVPDNFGPELLGESLHLTVRPFDWWLVRLASIGKVRDARDLCDSGLFVVTR